MTATAVFGGGCFWCTEAIFQRLTGVLKVTSGYAGGTTEDPSYEQVCTGTTGHAEVVKIDFDPDQISYHTLLEVFFATHDPTSVDRQGHDQGPQYRSIILTTTPAQQNEASAYINLLEKSHQYNRPVVTQIEPLQQFYPAEADHLEYFNRHRQVPYCQLIIDPKVKKLLKTYPHLTS